ncbi:MAG: hypothetical protein ACRECO_04430 [Xanthobacteraceae bacterium]
MAPRLLSIAAIGMLAALAAPASANAGSPCCCGMPCAAPAPVVVYSVPRPPIYIVNQGPVYSGPYIYSQPQIVFSGPIADFPYYAESYPAHYAPPRRYRRPPLRVRY